MNRTGLTLSAAAATLASLPAAAMLLGLPSAASASTATAHAQEPVFTTAAGQAACNWTPGYGTNAGHPGYGTDAGHPGYPLSPAGNGRLTYAGSDAGAAGPGPAASSGTAPNGGGSWQQVSTTAVSNLSIAGDTVSSLEQGHGSDVHYAPASPCDWTPVYHVGAGHSVTALSSIERGRVVYAAWADNDHGRSYGYGGHGQNCGCGIATNYGGSWHQVRTVGLPGQFITGITVDPFHPAHAYAVFNQDVSRFFHGTSQCGCGTGHVFETRDAGRNWINISGNLPRLLADALVLLNNGRLALATDGGVFTAFESRGQHTRWVHLGTGLPRVSLEDLTVGPDNCIYATAHGHGTWRFRF